MAAGETGPGPGWERFSGGDAHGSRLLGRDRELDVVGAVVGRLAAGTGGALVLRGEAGIGKSALLASAATRAGEAGVRVLAAVGVQAEASLPFAGLHQLLRPVLHLAERLPARQRAALLSAFGMSDVDAPELFLIGLAALEVISDAAASSPVLAIADDAQWLDEPSCAVLAFVARRLAAEPAAVLVALREGFPGPFDGAGLPELRLAGLEAGDAGALLDSRAPDLDPLVRDRLLAEAAGNPLALVELPEAVRAGQLEGGPLPARIPLTARLERAFAAQDSELPAVTRSVLLAAAANDVSALAEALEAASAMDGATADIGALAPAAAARLAEIDGTELRFRHPLVRSAIYQAAGVSRRRAAHAALAGVTAGQPDRRAWHRAAAALGPDERVAADLDAAATRAERRGAVTVAVDALRRAAQLSEEPVTRGQRLRRATDLAYDSGRAALGHHLLQAIEPLGLPADERTWVAWKREAYGDAGWSGPARIESFVGLADRMRAAGHVSIAADALLDVSLRCYFGNPSQQVRSAVIAAAERMALPADDPDLLNILASSDPVQRGKLVNDRIARMTADPGDPVGMRLIGTAATAVWAWDRSMVFLDAAVAGLRAQGRLRHLGQALVSRAWAAVHLARAPLAESAADEAARLATETGEVRWAAAARLAQAAAVGERGDAAAAEALAREGEAVLLSMGANPMLALVQFARGHTAVTGQRYAEGLAHLRRILDPADPAYHPFAGTWGLADLIEAAVHVGEAKAARANLDQLESLAEGTAGPLLLAQAAYARPLVAAADDAEALYKAALADGLANWPGYRARMLLSYGGWLRRRRRAVDSRVPLREARDAFDALGFAGLAEQARRELRASGESSPRQAPRPWDQLTPQELQIARMAAEGMSNREIGEQLYISHRTVSGALYRIFPKLGVTSRSQLHTAIPA